MDLQKLKDACVHDPFPTPFTDEALDNVGNQEAYSFTNGFSLVMDYSILFGECKTFGESVASQ